MTHLVEYNADLLLLNVLFWFVMLYISRPSWSYRNPNWNDVHKGVFAFFFIYTLHCIFAFYEHDTYHYWNAFIARKYGIYENIYNWLAKDVTDGNFFLWRVLIWTPACYFLYLTGKRLDCLTRNFLVAFLLLDIFIVPNTRGSLGHAMMLYGAVLTMDEQSKIRTKLVGVFLVGLSFFFHKSMFVNIIFALLAIYPLKKKGITILLIAFPFLTTAATYLIDNIVSGALTIDFGENMQSAGTKALGYAQSEKSVYNVNGIISLIVHNAPVYVSLVYVVYRVFYQEAQVEKVFIYLCRLAFVCIYIGSLFSFVETSNWISIRFRFMGMFPLPFVVGRLWSYDNESNRWIKLIILLALFQNLWKFTYQYYSWL